MRRAGSLTGRGWSSWPPVADRARVPSAVATVLGIREQPRVPVSDLAAALARLEPLLVQITASMSSGRSRICGALLTAEDDLRMLVTSREPVGVAGETRYRLRPLPAAGGP